MRPVSADTGIQLLVSDAEGNAAASARGRIAAGARAVSVRAPLAPASKGPWQVVMRVSGGELRGGETMSLSVAAGIVGDPQLLRVDAGGASPVARPVFSRRERLRATWTTIDAAELTRSEVRILDRRGQPLAIDATLSLAPAGSRTAASVDVALAPLAPGDYVLELVIAAGGTPSRHLLGFRVMQ